MRARVTLAALVAGGLGLGLMIVAATSGAVGCALALLAPTLLGWLGFGLAVHYWYGRGPPPTATGPPPNAAPTDQWTAVIWQGRTQRTVRVSAPTEEAAAAALVLQYRTTKIDSIQRS